MDSLEQASDALPVGASQDASREACALLEDEVPARRPPNAVGVVGEAPSEIAVRPSFLAKLANAGPHRLRLPNRLMLRLYVLSQEWDCPLADTMAPGPEAAWEIIESWSPFTKREHTCTTSTPLFSVYQWQLVLRSTPSSSPTIWIGSPSSTWQKTGCSSVTTVRPEKILIF